jgi:hypothetical protein
MKKINYLKLAFMLFSLSLIASSCNENGNKKQEAVKEVKNEGLINVENGRGEIDTISFKCYGCRENLDYNLFETIVKESSSKAKNNLNNPLSFVPVKMEIYINKEDSIYSFETGEKIENVLKVINNYEYIGKNAYGTEMGGEQIISFRLVDGRIKDIANDIKLEDLKFVDKYINRNLVLTDKNDFISFTPTQKKSIIVQSSLNCVDEKATFMITLENDEEINLYSWNDFNCDGNSYFKWFNKSQLEKLSASKVKYLYIYSRNNSVMIRVPKNESDYFQQLIKLYE